MIGTRAKPISFLHFLFFSYLLLDHEKSCVNVEFIRIVVGNNLEQKQLCYGDLVIKLWQGDGDFQWSTFYAYPCLHVIFKMPNH